MAQVGCWEQLIVQRSSDALAQVAQGMVGLQIPSLEVFHSHGDVALRAVSVGTMGWVGVGVGDLRGHFQPQ